MGFRHLTELLRSSAGENASQGLIVYRSGNTDVGYSIPYKKVMALALFNSKLVRRIEGFREDSIVLLHFDDQLENIIWFWSVLYAGGTPAISTPFVKDAQQREQHIRHLNTVLQEPICLTRLNLLGEFMGQEYLNIHTVEALSSSGQLDALPVPSQHPFTSKSELALLMLTSGSTGNAKVVCLSHRQILTAISGKASVKKLPAGHAFLNWVGLDHVASMVEIHLQALYVNVDQIHIHSSEVVSDPLLFLELISKHKVATSFAPNFFLAKIRQAMMSESVNARQRISRLDLSCLQFLATGGEANVVETCAALSELLGRYGAPRNVIVPGFGMTETCAGAIFNCRFPEYDLENGYEFASLGTCMPGMELRINVSTEKGEPRTARRNEPGNLELSGPAVFQGYFNNLSATADAFTRDGWFKTGDRAMIDTAGQLNFIGRVKETLNINGVKYLPHEIEAAIEGLSLPAIMSGCIVCLPYHLSGMETEEICVIYAPSYVSDDIDSRVDTHRAIVQAVMLHTGSRPHILPLDYPLLPKSTLGKFSRAKMQKALRNGDYDQYKEMNEAIIRNYHASNYVPPANEIERTLLNAFADNVEFFEEAMFGVETPIFEMGVTSVHLIRLKREIERRLSIDDIPIVKMMAYPTVRSLAGALHDTQGHKTYDPVVKLQLNGSKIPLWLVHPGVGEVLVFLGLAKYMTDRPVFALRARGFDGEPCFASISEAVEVYHAAIKAHQPKGPYALAGYSYGTMLAFEIAKVLEADGDEVRFLGSFNLPPHIKSRMEQLNWTQCLLHLSYFLGLITDQHAESVGEKLQTQSKEEVLSYITLHADPARWAELSLTVDGLGNWANLAFGLQKMATSYEPSGFVKTIDVFYAIPLRALSLTKEEWRDGHLSKWANFVESEPRFHDVGGEHYTMIGPDHVHGFQKKLRAALKDRGV